MIPSVRVQRPHRDTLCLPAPWRWLRLQDDAGGHPSPVHGPRASILLTRFGLTEFSSIQQILSNHCPVAHLEGPCCPPPAGHRREVFDQPRFFTPLSTCRVTVSMASPRHSLLDMLTSPLGSCALVPVLLCSPPFPDSLPHLLCRYPTPSWALSSHPPPGQWFLRLFS